MAEIQKGYKIVLAIFRGLLTVALIGYIGYTVSLAVYKNYQTNQKINSLKADILKLEEEIGELKNLIVYYQTDSFKELEARRRLGLKGQGEKMIILPKDLIKEEMLTDDSEVGLVEKPSEESVSNYQLWWEFIFNN